eukprot:COSAG02_NODE_67579_length_252_cov_1.326797_1_plen_43_part_01
MENGEAGDRQMHQFGGRFEGISVWIPGPTMVHDTPALGRWIRR